MPWMAMTHGVVASVQGRGERTVEARSPIDPRNQAPPYRQQFAEARVGREQACVTTCALSLPCPDTPIVVVQPSHPWLIATAFGALLPASASAPFTGVGVTFPVTVLHASHPGCPIGVVGVPEVVRTEVGVPICIRRSAPFREASAAPLERLREKAIAVAMLATAASTVIERWVLGVFMGWAWRSCGCGALGPSAMNYAARARNPLNRSSRILAETHAILSCTRSGNLCAVELNRICGDGPGTDAHHRSCNHRIGQNSGERKGHVCRDADGDR